jgi:transposase
MATGSEILLTKQQQSDLCSIAQSRALPAGYVFRAKLILLLAEGSSFNAIKRQLQIHIILDNLSAHKTQAVREFLQQHPRVRFHFTPTYSSWLNQVEIWFAKIEREVIARGIFTSVPDLARKLRRSINAYSVNARPIQ